MMLRQLSHCHLFSDKRLNLINNIRNIDSNILNLNNWRFSEVLLFGNSSFNNTKNTSSLNTTIEYIVSYKTFEVLLFDWYSWMAVLFTSYYFLFFYFPLSLTYYLYFFYHVTCNHVIMNMIFGIVIVFYPFYTFVNICFSSQKELAQIT